ncbi:TPA: GABA permease [Burkholderia vietnamiensis]|uniref:GABA permease n=1 Tax=Burkholderia vietnamiensis TaxID=60552 RepID=UPI00264C2753|nr:GABA permease [Burkholderia vietnamiensis]MDN8076418.1 GABA permease [Burkholderia vietnamiensis]HDR8985476.1 GABA permease [Burkholderia vietnamiensis]
MEVRTESGLSNGLKQRHVTMMSIAGVIGAGLFVGSGHAIASAGPAAVIAYAITGALIVLVMRMLGEMATAQPDSGSFSTYADRAIGHWAGFTIGWLYWWFWVLVIPIEATAAATILNAWFPSVATWIFALGITTVLTVTNLFSVKNYGEFEFWFALIKVVAIIVFLCIGAAAIVGIFPHSNVSGAARLFNNGGFMPNGIGAVFAAMLTVMFSFMGTEIVTIAAAESDDPQSQIVRATNSVIWRISLFYLGSILVVTSIVPWNDALLSSHGSYQRAMELIGIPHAKAIIDIVVLVSVASCLNSALYTASRMIFSLSKRGDAPAFLRKTDAAGTPRAAVFASTAFGFLTVIANYLMPDYVFNFLLATSGAIALLVYLVIAVSQLRMRETLEAGGARIQLKMWCFPWLTWLVIVFICGLLIAMLSRDAQRMEVAATGALATIVVAASWLNQARRKREDLSAPVRVSVSSR